MRIPPTLELERNLLAAAPNGAVLGGVDEVGRGPIAGPVSVGIAIMRAGFDRPLPAGLADSKQLTARRREALVPKIKTWVEDVAVGHADSNEIDAHGIIGGLRLAAQRAFTELAARGNAPTLILLDGSHNWWSEESPAPVLPQLPVTMQVKGDARCALVSAASVVAKVARDAIMTELDRAYPGYHWAKNKGYATREHVEALDALGPSPHHRISWHLPTRRSTHE
ncbi:ribonuclease HII [Neoactinobaculum massilliense]|uniref:ribonuclease HII n=1 Tax=Neoactinobaculum massilliense TaxID=2364794 RepID=UPI0030B95A8C